MVVSEPTEELPEAATQVDPTEDTLGQSVEIAKYQYISALQYAHKLMNTPRNGRKKLSARNIQRAVFAAVDHGITDSKVKFTRKEEAELAGVFAKMLDLRTIIQAGQMKEQKSLEKETSELTDTITQESKNDKTNDTNKD